jgi:uncharacterized protein (TIRG00374 family)
MPAAIVAASAAAQVCSYIGSGYLIKAILHRMNVGLSVFRGVLITMAAASLGLVAGGWAASAAATFYWVSKDYDVSEEALLAGILPSVYNTAVLIAVTFVGMAHLMFNHEFNGIQFAVYGLIITAIALYVILVFYGLRHRSKVENVAIKITEKLSRFRKSGFNPDEISSKIEDLYKGIDLLGSEGWIKLGMGSIFNILFDMLTLYMFFKASGYSISLSILTAGYSIAFLMGRGAFFVPGGIGVIEGGMAAIYINLGVPNDISIVSVLGYRFVSFWLPSILGFLSMIYLQRIIRNKQIKGE